jgi:hypothetical protein
MAFDELKSNLAEADASFRSYLDSSKEYYKLKGFKFIMQGVTAFSQILLIGVAALLTLFFLSLAASYGIGQLLDNTFLGFLIVGIFYLLLGVIFYALRHRLNRPLLQKFSEFYFDEL